MKNICDQHLSLENGAETCTTNMFADDTEIEDTCKPEYHSTLGNNINSDLSRL